MSRKGNNFTLTTLGNVQMGRQGKREKAQRNEKIVIRPVTTFTWFPSILAITLNFDKAEHM